MLSPCRSRIHARAFHAINASVNALVHTVDPIPSSSSTRTIAVKDNICTLDMPTTCSSAMLKDFVPPYNATVVALLRSSGAAIVGKANCDEFGMGSLNVHTIHGPVVNPHQIKSCTKVWAERERRSAGGSSGGSAAAVAAKLCHAALGTDTGGSIRLPSSYCGIVGLKPSYGIVSRWGVVSFADSLDCVGVMAQDVGGVRAVFDIISNYDPRDPTAATPETRQKALEACRKSWSGAQNDLGGLRIGVPQEYFPAELSSGILAATRRVLAALQARGAELISVSLPSTSYALSAYYVIASAEASSNMAKYDGVQYGLQVPSPPGSDKTNTAKVYARTREVGFGPEVKKRILLGTYALTAGAFDNYFLQAQRIRKMVRSDFDHVFRSPTVLCEHQDVTSNEGVDVLLHPSAIRSAPLLDEKVEKGLDAYVQDVLTVPASLAGLPAMSVPAGLTGDGWPVGVSVVGPWGHDELVMRVGEAIEACMEEL